MGYHLLGFLLHASPLSRFCLANFAGEGSLAILDVGRHSAFLYVLHRTYLALLEPNEQPNRVYERNRHLHPTVFYALLH